MFNQSEQSTEQENKKNGKFVQYDETNISFVRDLIKKNPVSADIFMFLSQHMNRKNAVACPSKVLEEVTGKGRTTVSNAIKVLRNEGYICTAKMGTTNVYVLNPTIVWKAWRTGKPYCEFEGKMFISKSENKELEDLINKKNFPIIES